MTDLNYFEGILQVVFFLSFFKLAPEPLKDVSERETKFVSARDNFVAPPQKMSRTETIRANLSRTETILPEDPGGGDNSIPEALKASGIETQKRQKKTTSILLPQ